MKKIINKIKQNKGAVSVEAALVCLLIFPIFISLIVGGYCWSTAQSTNVNINFETGRYVSTVGCNYSKLNASMPSLTKYEGYEIIVNDIQLTNMSGSNEKIVISCPVESTRGSEFEVTTIYPVFSSAIYNLFPATVVRSGIYVQEAD